MAPVAAARLNPPDATQEAWVDVGRGAYTGHLSIFVFRSCQLAGHFDGRCPWPLPRAISPG